MPLDTNVSLILHNLGERPDAPNSRRIVEAMLAAGYRKFEIVDEPAAPADGGPAFGELKQVGDRTIKQGGLTIRDYFAASALQGIFANDGMISRFGKVAQAENVSPDVLAATAAYSVAESMLKERAK